MEHKIKTMICTGLFIVLGYGFTVVFNDIMIAYIIGMLAISGGWLFSSLNSDGFLD